MKKIMIGLFILMLLAGCSATKMGNYETNMKQCHRFYKIDDDNKPVWVIDTNSVGENWFCDRPQATLEDGFFFGYITIHDNRS